MHLYVFLFPMELIRIKYEHLTNIVELYCAFLKSTAMIKLAKLKTN